jgi:hypothetical protein
VQFQRLQVEPEDVGSRRRRQRYVGRAWSNLQALEGPRFPDPALANDARQVAAWYRDRFPDRFRHIQID